MKTRSTDAFRESDHGRKLEVKDEAAFTTGGVPARSGVGQAAAKDVARPDRQGCGWPAECSWPCAWTCIDPIVPGVAPGVAVEHWEMLFSHAYSFHAHARRKVIDLLPSPP